MAVKQYSTMQLLNLTDSQSNQQMELNTQGYHCMVNILYLWTKVKLNNIFQEHTETTVLHVWLQKNKDNTKSLVKL